MVTRLAYRRGWRSVLVTDCFCEESGSFSFRGSGGDWLLVFNRRCGVLLDPGMANIRGHPNLCGANPCVRLSPFVDFFGVFSLFYEAGQPPSQLARECTPTPNLSISSQGTT